MTEAISPAVNASVIDLFRSVRGLLHGFKAEAFKLVASIDIDEVCRFVSEQGRHVREGQTPRLEETELAVTAAATVYLLRASAGASAS